MKCFAITAQGTHCSRQVVSGNTLDLDGHIVRLCNQHYKNVVSIAQAWTSEPKFINNVQEDTMNTINSTITANEIKENNVPNSPVTGSSDRGDKWIKCVKCSKEIGSDWYHANVADMRTCMGAAPAPVKAKTSIRGGFEVDVMSGMSVRGDYTWFFDSSREVVKAKYMELQAAGRNPFPMKKTSKGDWQVAFRTIQS
jgi:hypothetical protein